MLEKKYPKSSRVCVVTFVLPEAIEADSACLVGEFNDWDAAVTPMTRGEDGVFRATLELAAGREYQFRYLVDGEHWHNDWRADAYVPNGLGEDNSVVATTQNGESTP